MPCCRCHLISHKSKLSCCNNSNYNNYNKQEQKQQPWHKRNGQTLHALALSLVVDGDVVVDGALDAAT